VNNLDENGQLAMLDFKFHDIPGTVERSVRKATRIGGSLITVHASGGQEMLEAAVVGAEKGRADFKDVFKNVTLPKVGHILGITVLTSLDAEDCFSIFGIPKDDEDGIKKKVLQFTEMALEAGLTGIVCSPLETEAIRSKSKFDSLLVVNPGITPMFAKKAGDQKRTTNATQAINAGADMVVVGGGINKASDYGMTKAEAAQAVGEEIGTALRGGNE
jgi:orotidine-5'-phosphate decarboxylase